VPQRQLPAEPRGDVPRAAGRREAGDRLGPATRRRPRWYASQLFIAGSSAGAHLASCAALSANHPALQPGFEAVDTSVTAVVALYGYYGPVDAIDGTPSSPATWAGGPCAALPPGPRRQGHRRRGRGRPGFVHELRAASRQPVVYAELPGGHHVFDLFHSVRFDSVVGAVEGFAWWVLARRGPGVAPPEAP
jgi:acetyl esterase/lipase